MTCAAWAPATEWLEFHGADRMTALGRSHYETFPELPERWKAIHRRGLAGEACRCELDLVILGDGSKRWLRWTVVPWHRESGGVAGIVMTAEDVTRERELEHSLHAAESILNALFESVSVGLAITDAQGRILRTNAAYRTLVGHGREALLNMFLGSVIHPADARAAIEGLGPLRQGAETMHESRCRVMRPDGSEIEVEQLIAAIHGADGAPMRMAVFARDVSERSALHAQLREADHLASVGRLGAGLAHDLGNLVFVFRSAMAGIRAALADPSQRKAGDDSVAMLAGATEYVERMTDALRLLSSPSHAEQGARGHEASVELGEWWKRSSFLVERAVPRGVAVEANLEDGLGPVRLAPADLTQVVLNLVSNAGNAIAERAGTGAPRGTVRIYARLEPSSGRACMVVTDDGPGMPPEVERHAFEPYFSRRTDGAGTGIGLSLVKRLVDAAGGTVSLDSRVGVGTTVTVLLPFVA